MKVKYKIKLTTDGILSLEETISGFENFKKIDDADAEDLKNAIVNEYISGYFDNYSVDN